MISKEEVLKIAKLSQLELTDIETEKMQKDLSVILDYFDLLKNLDTSLAQTKNHSLQTTNSSLRRDEVASQKIGVSEKMIAFAPNKKDGYIKVKAIL